MFFFYRIVAVNVYKKNIKLIVKKKVLIMKFKNLAIILFCIFAFSFVFVSCEKQMEQTLEDKYGVTEFKEKIQTGVLVENKEKSTNIYEEAGAEGMIFYYYPDRKIQA